VSGPAAQVTSAGTTVRARQRLPRRARDTCLPARESNTPPTRTPRRIAAYNSTLDLSVIISRSLITVKWSYIKPSQPPGVVALLRWAVPRCRTLVRRSVRGLSRRLQLDIASRGR